MDLLNRDQILGAARALPRERVTIKDWGGDVFVRAMSASEYETWEALITESNGQDVEVNTENARARLAVMTVCDEEGKLLFTEADIPGLSAQPARSLVKIYNIAARLNGLRKEDVEELAKNSAAGQTGSSSTR